MSTATLEQINASKLATFAELTMHKRALEAEVRDINRRLENLQEDLLEEFGMSAVSSVRLDGATVTLHRQLWAKCLGGDYPRACAALRAAGLGDFVEERFNSNSLSAHLRELDRDGQPLPAALRGALDVSEVISLRVTKR